MSPFFSRSSAFRKIRKALRNDQHADEGSYYGLETIDFYEAQKIQKRVDSIFDEERTLQSEIEDSFFRLMLGSKMSPLEFVKALGQFDSELPRKNPEEFNSLLEYFWDRVNDYYMDMEEVLDVLCGAFPNYERVILKSAYMAYEVGEIECGSHFVILLERMADLDEIDGENHFSSNADEKLMDYLSEPLINICDRCGFIFDMMTISSPIYDVVWLLENRFGVPSEELREFVLTTFNEFYMSYTIDDLMMFDSIGELFKLPEGYDLFFQLAPYVMRGYDGRDLEDISDEYGISLKVNIGMCD